MAPNKYTDAIAEWDDRARLFRVYLMPELMPEVAGDAEHDPEPKPLEAVHFESDGDTECRLYKAAFCACPRDIGRLSAGREIGWEKEAPAKRVAKAVKRELKRIDKGMPGPDATALQIAILLAKPKGRRS